MRLFFRHRSRLRPIAVAVLVVFVCHNIEQFHLLAWDQSPSQVQPPLAPEPAFEELESAVDTLDRLFGELDAGAVAGTDVAPALEAVDGQARTVDAIDLRVRAALNAIERRLIDAGADPGILERHRQFVASYDSGLQELRSQVAAVKQARQDELGTQVGRARSFLKDRRGRPHTPLNPEDLPYRQPKPKERQPRLRREEFTEQKPLQVASNAAPFALLERLEAQADAPAENLAETPDVQFSQGIRDLAATLGGNPVAIYNWVRQNITFVPTFGSIQGSEACRVSRECNAHDAASLLIALLRVSGIPARYVLGTIEVPADLFRRAVGDFQDVEAAARFASSGGVPVTMLRSAAGIVAVRMEHVWVEAYVDYVPSRGAARGAGDTWVPLDGVLKPTRFRAPLDFAAAGVDPQAIVDAVRATGTPGAGGASITGMSQAQASAQLTNALQTLKTFIDTSLPDATVGDIVGAVDIVAAPVAVLPASLPARVLVAGARLSVLPDTSRHTVTLRLMDQFGLTEQIRVERSTAALAGRRLTLGYVPNSAADVATIESFGGLFKTPAYLVRLRPAIYLDGAVLNAGPSVPMGTTQQLRVSFREPDGGTDSVEHLVTAGTYAALGLDLQTVSREALMARRQKLEATRSAFGVQDVNWDDILGEILHLHAQTYFLQVEASSRLTAHQLNVGALKRPAEMLATFSPAFAYVFGAPVRVTRTGMNVDVRRYVVSVSSRTGDRADELGYMVTTGSLASAAEHSVFEHLQNARSVSAIKLIAEANNRGIPVFTIDASNAGTILPQLRVSSGVLADVRNSIAAGKQVLIPRDELTFLQWRGVGYIVLDPATGAAGYLISGGLAGGGTAEASTLTDFLETLLDIISFLVDLVSAIADALRVISKLTAWLPIIGNILTAISALATGYSMYKETGSIWKGLAAGAVDLLLSLAAGAAVTALVGVIFPSIAGLIVIAVAVVLITVVVALIENAILEIIKNARLRDPVRWLARLKPDLGPPFGAAVFEAAWGAA